MTNNILTAIKFPQFCIYLLFNGSCTGSTIKLVYVFAPAFDLSRIPSIFLWSLFFVFMKQICQLFSQ